MRLNNKVFLINIPFKLEFSHARARRSFSDSLIVVLENERGTMGFGEAIIRDYVSGRLANKEEGGSLTETAAKIVEKVLSPFRDREFGGEGLLDNDNLLRSMEILKNYFTKIDVKSSELPLVCASELALLDYICRESDRDIYELLKKEPVRKKIYYGGTLPILPFDMAKDLLFLFKKMEISNIRIKLSSDVGYTDRILSLARGILGEKFDIRVDANSSWDLTTTLRQMEILREFGVRIIEDPVEDEDRDLPLLFNRSLVSDFVFVSDESMLDFRDVERIGREKYFSMINIRLSKNGGIFRSLKIAEMAEERNIKYQVGCHVGETGILSAAGRVVASLLKDPVYVDGSYDSYILSDNVTTENISFGLKGEAPVIRGKSLGYTADIERVRKLSVEIKEYS